MYFGGICFITDRTISSLPVEEMVKMVLDSGVGFIQYREKELPRREIYFKAEKLRKLTDEYEAVLVINDHADIALAVEADGVHLGQEDLPVKEARKIMGRRVVGISTHDVEQAVQAEQGGADYIGFGPMFHTTTKDAGRPRGTVSLVSVRKAVKIPIVAVGGISLDDLGDVFRSGADAVAVASAILKSGNISSAARKLVEKVRAG